MKLTPCRLKEIVHEEARKLQEDEIGWDNLPDGWDEDSLDSFARSLTDKTQNDSEGFFTACMDEVEDKFDDPEAFCASLKDEYLGTTDWRGESANKPKNMKLTESKLRSIIREELLSEQDETVMRFVGVGEDAHASRGITLQFSLESGDMLVPGDERVERLLRSVDQASPRDDAYVEGRRIDVIYGSRVSTKRLSRLIKNSPYTI